jgi:hypothetical protein
MTLEVMSGIWSNRVDYSVSIGLSHWMDSFAPHHCLQVPTCSTCSI